MTKINITITAPAGAGKSTIGEFITQRLRGLGIKVNNNDVDTTPDYKRLDREHLKNIVSHIDEIDIDIIQTKK